MWALVAGLCHLIAPEFAPGFYPSWYFALGAVGYGLLLPVIASLHVRHEPLRRSGAVLGTIAGVIAAEHNHEQPVFVPAYPYDHDHDAYAYGRDHRRHFHDQDRWRQDER